MHIIKIKTKITDLSFGQIRPGLGITTTHSNLPCGPQKPQTNN